MSICLWVIQSCQGGSNWIKHSRLVCALVSHHYKLFHLPSSCLECKMIKCISFHASKFVGGIAIRKGLQWFWLCTAVIAIMNWRLLAKTHPGSEVVSTVLFLSPSSHHCSLNSNSTIITSCTLIGMRWRLATYIIQAAFECGLNTICQGIHKVRIILATRSADSTILISSWNQNWVWQLLVTTTV